MLSTRANIVSLSRMHGCFKFSNSVDTANKLFSTNSSQLVSCKQTLLNIFSWKSCLYLPKSRELIYSLVVSINHAADLTGWSFAQDENSVIVIKERETHAGTANGVHQILKDGKALRIIDAVVDLLAQEGVNQNNQ